MDRMETRGLLRWELQAKLRTIGGVMDKRQKIRTVPGFVRPMLCKTVAQLPTGDDWVFEVKRGGKRTIAVKDGRRVRLYDEEGKRIECASVEAALRQAPLDSAVIDGELISLSPQHDDRSEDEDCELRLYAWDLLHLNGQDMTTRPVEHRKQRLCTLTLDSDVLFSPSLACEPAQLLEEVGRLSLEGVVAKRKGSIYEPGKCSGSWMRVPVRSK